MSAVYNGHFEIVKLLVENGAKVNIKNNFGDATIDFCYGGLASDEVKKKMCEYLEAHY